MNRWWILSISLTLMVVRIFFCVVAFACFVHSCQWLFGSAGPIQPGGAYWLIPASRLVLCMLYFLHYSPLLTRPKTKQVLRMVIVFAVVLNLRFFLLPVSYAHPKLDQFPKMADEYEAAKYNSENVVAAGHTEAGITYWYLEKPKLDLGIATFVLLPIAFYAWGVYTVSRGITVGGTLSALFPRVFGKKKESEWLG